jgi:hypothetical protein
MQRGARIRKALIRATFTTTFSLRPLKSGPLATHPSYSSSSEPLHYILSQPVASETVNGLLLVRFAAQGAAGDDNGLPHHQTFLSDHLYDVNALANGVLSGERLALSRAITLSESTRPDHQFQAAALLRILQGNVAERGDRNLFRIGVSGPPGAGKSTLIESLGCAMLDAGKKVAVLAIDPSSVQSGGAILGDKTRMPK